MRVMTFALALFVGVDTLSALAHGPQLQITRDGDQIVTRKIFREEPYNRLTDPTRVYVIPLMETADVWYSRPNNTTNSSTGFPEYTSGPGIAYGYDQIDGGPRDFTPGFRFELKLIDSLQWWDGSAFVDPGLEEIEAFRSSGSPAVTNDSLTPASPATLAYGNLSTPSPYGPTAHSGASFRLLGNGTSATVDGDDGVYLLSMTYASTQPGLAASDPFFFLLHKNADGAEVSAALSSLLSSHDIGAAFVQVVPEPTIGVHVAIAVTSLLARRRSRTH